MNRLMATLMLGVFGAAMLVSLDAQAGDRYRRDRDDRDRHHGDRSKVVVVVDRDRDCYRPSYVERRTTYYTPPVRSYYYEERAPYSYSETYSTTRYYDSYCPPARSYYSERTTYYTPAPRRGIGFSFYYRD